MYVCAYMRIHVHVFVCVCVYAIEHMCGSEDSCRSVYCPVSPGLLTEVVKLGGRCLQPTLSPTHSPQPHSLPSALLTL